MTGEPIRLLSIAVNVPGPVVVARLVASGASAVKVEPPWGDPLQALNQAWYDELHHRVRVERLDLKTDAGRQALAPLLDSATVFISSHRPAALRRLGLDPASLARHHPALRSLNIVGDTASPDEAGHDLTYQAKAGLLEGALPATLLADMMGAARAHAAVLELVREAPGSARVVGLFDSLTEACAPLRHGLTAPGGPLGGANPAYAVYAARDGSVAVAALEPHFRARLYQALDLPDGSDLSAPFRARTAEEWEQWAKQRDIPITRIAPPRR